MANIVYRQMPTPRELPQQIPTPEQKLGCKSHRVGVNVWCKSPGVCGEMVMDEIDTCIILRRFENYTFQLTSQLHYGYRLLQLRQTYMRFNSHSGENELANDFKKTSGELPAT